MIIDIDIKIADSDGKLLHRLEKHIDKFDFINEEINFNLDMGKSFEEYLSVYMSYSGRAIREKLIGNSNGLLTGKTLILNTQNQDIDRLKNTDNPISEHEVEYHISFGGNNIFTGKFPFQRPSQENTIDDNIDSYDDNYEEDWDISRTMAKAIEKYEANFYEINQISNEMEPYITAVGLNA